MSELHIRINRRTFERIIFTLIILVLAGMLFFQQPDTAVDEQQVSDLQSQVDNLSATNDDLRSQVDSLQSQVSTLEAENQDLTEPDGSDEQQTQSEPEPEPEPELSGEIEVDWSASLTSDDALDYVTLVIDNGLESTQQLTYDLMWAGGEIQSNDVDERGTATVSSGERETIVIDGYLSEPGDRYDSLILEINDEEGSVVFEEERTIR